MIKLLVVEPRVLTSVGWWRIYRPLMVMSDLFPGVFQFSFKREKLDYADIANCNVVLISRPGGKDTETLTELAEKARSIGRPVIMDLDDDILNLPDTHELYGQFQKKKKQIEKAFEPVSLFWYSTPAFLESGYPKNGIVVPNAVLPGDLPDDPAPDRGVWAWRGRGIQVHDLMAAGADWYDKNKDKVKRWMFLGYKPPLKHGENVGVVPYVDDTDKFMGLLKASRFNGIWKPMVQCRFNDHKSNIAWIEATITGGVCLTNYAGRPGWENAAAEFPTYKEACALWEQSRQTILEQYNLTETARLRAACLFQICSHLLPTSPATATT